MFEQLIKRTFHRKRHLNAPLLEERLKYIQYWADQGLALNTLKDIANYTLRIVEFLQLDNFRIITLDELERAAEAWGCYQSNHPQKRAAFSKTGKEKFIWYARDWLKTLSCLEKPPEEKIPLFNKIFERRKALKRHATMPLLPERLKYLQNLADNGAVANSLRGTAQYLLIVMKYIDFYQLRIVAHDEIEKAADRWAHDEHYRRKSDYSKSAKKKFIRDALDWLKMLGCLKKENKPPIPFEEYLNQYFDYMRHEQGLSENTIESRFFQLKDFLINLDKKQKSFITITPQIIDDILIKKHNSDGNSRRTIQAYASVIRTFIRYAENKRWCQKNLADSIKAPRVYRYESLPSSPSWDDVKKILASSKTNHPTDIRDHAILMLLSIYGLRCSEVTHLKLEDLDWKNERIYIKRAKLSKPQIFPLSKTVGEAILRYIKEVRQNTCSLREVFLCRRSPYRPLDSSAIYQIVSRRLKPLGLNIKHHGPHALRHACATHLINEGISLKEISDHLGHQGLETTRIYTKVDLTNLRKVAEFELGGLL